MAEHPPAAGRWAVAPDLPGFGASDNPPDAPYTLDFHTDVLEGFLRALGIERTALVVHDLGGLVGLLWAVRHPERVERLVVLDTLVYPELGLVMRALLSIVRLPGIGRWVTSRAGLAIVVLGERVRSSLLQRHGTGNGRRQHGGIHRIWERYGVVGLGLLAPLLVGAPLGAALGPALGAPAGRLLRWMSLGIAVWAAVLTLAGALRLAGIESLRH